MVKIKGNYPPGALKMWWGCSVHNFHPTVEPMFDDLLRLQDNQGIFELRLTICYF